MSASTYTPAPIDTANVVLTDQLTGLNERLAENIHELWAKERIAQGWKYGPQRDDAKKEHPCLVPYDQLPDSEKEFDRGTAVGTLKTILKLGHRIEPGDGLFTIEDTQALHAWEKHLNSSATDARSGGPRSWTFDMDDQPEIDWLEKNLPQLHLARAALQELRTTVLPDWQREDAAALKKQKWHHRTAAIAIWPGIAGIIFAIIQLTYRRDGMILLGLMETLSVTVAALAVVGGFYFHLHHGWLAHRQCAERLRILKFTALSWAELWTDFPAWQRRLKKEVQALTNISTKSAHHWAQEKETLHPELPAAVTGPVPLPDLQAISLYYRIKRLEFQRHYFEHQSSKAHSRSWIVDLKVGLWIFVLSAVIVLIHGAHTVWHGWLHDFFASAGASVGAHGAAAPHAEGAHAAAAHAAAAHAAAAPLLSPATELTAEILGIALAAVLPVIGFGFRAWLAAFEAPRSRNLFRAKARAIDDYIARGNAGSTSINQTLNHIAYSEHFFNNEHREWCRLQMEAEWFV